MSAQESASTVGGTSTEQRGIEYIPAEERHGKPRDIRWMWAGGVFNVQMVAFGALIPIIGLSFVQSVIVIIIGNLSWLAAGAASLPGPAAGTTGFVIQRSAFGIRGSKIPTTFNWITQVLFEISSFVLAILALLALLGEIGVDSTTPVKLGVIVVAAVVQFILPALGHGMIVRALNVLLIPFALSFLVMAILTIPKIDDLGAAPSADFAVMTQGLALVFALAGFSWMANGADFARYLPASTGKWSLVGNVAIGGAVPMSLLMILGAAVSSISDAAADPIGGLPTIFPTWFVVPYLIFAVVQLMALTSLDLYSSGVTLQALGIKVSRTVAIAVDLILCSTIAGFAIFSDGVYDFIANILLFVMVWLAAWGGIFIVDYFLRRGRYDTPSFFAGARGIYWGTNGFNFAGLIALAAGGILSLCWLNTTIFSGPISDATGGSDLSTLVGFVVGASVYFVLARKGIRESTDIDGPPTDHVASPEVPAELSTPIAQRNETAPDETLSLK